MRSQYRVLAPIDNAIDNSVLDDEEFHRLDKLIDQDTITLKDRKYLSDKEKKSLQTMRNNFEFYFQQVRKEVEKEKLIFHARDTAYNLSL